MNKTQLVDALATRIGDRRTAATAVDALLDTIVDAVRAGESVSITGFGVFEPRARAARTARNPRTGEAVQVAATTVPAFRPGAGFRSAVGGGGSAPAPRATPARTPAAAEVEAPVETPAESSGAAPAEPAAPRKAATSQRFAAAEEPKRAKKSAKDGAGGKAAKGSAATGSAGGKKAKAGKDGKDGGKNGGKGRKAKK
jgi:DNA-binding protein HU-beta